MAVPLTVFRFDDPRVSFLHNGRRLWWDPSERQMVPTAVLYLLQGCSDWGRCTYCSLPLAAEAGRQEFFEGRRLEPAEHLGIFSANLRHLAPPTSEMHTIIVFNAGSFFAEQENEIAVQEGVAAMIAEHPTVRRLVIESRAQLIKSEALRRLTSILSPAGKSLTVRIGVETKDDHLRGRVLQKGQTRRQLLNAVAAMKGQGVTAGGYVLLNPAPGLDPEWARGEALSTVDWLLDSDGLGMDEAYFRPTCVAPGSKLEPDWRNGTFRPADLWSTWWVAREAIQRYGTRVHLLPFSDEPAFLAVPSNHVPKGIPETLDGARGCDREFYHHFQQYRETMDPAALENMPGCSCRPDWVEA